MKKSFLKPFVLLPVCLLVYTVQAQLNTTNNGILYINGNSTVVTINGSFTNSATATLTNNGQLVLKSNLVNNEAAITAGTGTLALTGTTAQTVSGSHPFKTHHFNTNNAAGIVLNTNVVVSGNHTFSDGIITTSVSPSYLVYAAGATYSGESDTKHINGWVKKLGASNFSFPVGNGTYIRKADLVNLSVAGEFDCRYAGATPNTALNELELPLRSVNPNEHWIINKISGGTAQVQLNWQHAKVPFPDYIIPDVRTAQFANSKWINSGGTASGTATTTGTITSTALSAFGRLAIGSASFVVPLQFISITAMQQGKSNKIEWKTFNEWEVSHYEIEKSFNAVSFSVIGSVPARNNMDLQTYQFTDVNTANNKVYYRIKSVDKDGAVQFTKIVAINATELTTALTLVQNPVYQTIEIKNATSSPLLTNYAITTLQGQTIKKGTLLFTGNSISRIPVAGIANGTYLLSILYQDQHFVKQIIKQ